MRYPSVKTLSAIFNDPKTARGVLDGDIDPCEASRNACELESTSYHLPPFYLLQMEALNELGGFYGVESFQYSGGFIEYLNAGDTYVPTLFYRSDLRDRWQVSTLGDVVETLERKGYTVS